MTSILAANDFLENHSQNPHVGSIYFVINEIFIKQTFYSETVLKKVKRCKNEVLKTRVCDLSLIIL